MSEIAGRFVIPVTPTYKRTVGIVHDSSRTGKTLYVEPTQVFAQAGGCNSCFRRGGCFAAEAAEQKADDDV